MRIIEFNADDPELIAGAFELLTAAHKADTPENPVPVRRYYETTYTHLFPGRVKHWFAAVENGKVVGYLVVYLWTDSNPQLAIFDAAVHPEHRGKGIGTALLAQVETTAREKGRSILTTEAPLYWEGGPKRTEAGARLLEKHGFSRALTCVNRRSKVASIDPAEEERLYAGALAAAGDTYTLRQWVGPVPEDLLATMARMESTIISEIPLGDLEIEPEDVDTEKIRAKEVVYLAEGRINLHSVAVAGATGEVVAWSEIGLDDGPYIAGHQGITIVAPGHRGHRLGLLTKLANLRLLREHSPHVEEIWTDNADVNEHMIAINATLGYETVDAYGEYQRKLES
ncbi:GNAT family N-acetyltransferase [Glycomyces buryatensis]|uniref:GNAT family N-acetyltransferase n=1 Tax=Glycomyces buryatensis TaxID=2570927 RepID=A0A4S8Q377_9ACTN|nr:GNAT family N-acetyltransferase [Glycomyces buryatensis]THV38568.1 GNAT family N-acetyltransferase [Glycomyces buryatensis]